jgi:hypothetical protein
MNNQYMVIHPRHLYAALEAIGIANQKEYRVVFSNYIRLRLSGCSISSPL